MNTTMPPKELMYWYKHGIEEARSVFGSAFTCKRKIAPHMDKFEVAVMPLEFKSDKYDNVQVSLAMYPATFMDATLRKGDRKVVSIATGSGSVKELWDMVKPILKLLEMGVAVQELRNDRRFRKIAKLEGEGQIGFYEYDGEGNPVKKEEYRLND